MTVIVWALIGTLLAFTGVTMWFNFQGIQVQSELIVAFFSAITGELATMGGIQITKIRKRKKKEDNNDDSI